MPRSEEERGTVLQQDPINYLDIVVKGGLSAASQRREASTCRAFFRERAGVAYLVSSCVW